MTNRIGIYTGMIEDIQRARNTLAFCEVILQISGDSMRALEMAAIKRLQREASKVFRDFNLELPGERPK